MYTAYDLNVRRPAESVKVAPKLPVVRQDVFSV